MAYFPMYVNIEKQPVLVVGGGIVALRKVEVLLDFGAAVLVVAPELVPEIKQLPGVCWEEREFREKDLEGCVLAVAATSDAVLNHQVSNLAKQSRIPVNVVDQKEDCTFIFPAYVKEKNLVGAFSSGGNSPVLTQYLKMEMSQILTERLGIVNENLGQVREYVQAALPSLKMRKQLYQQLFGELQKQSEMELLTREQMIALAESLVQTMFPTESNQAEEKL